MENFQQKLEAFKKIVEKNANDKPNFKYRERLVKDHLEIVGQYPGKFIAQ